MGILDHVQRRRLQRTKWEEQAKKREIMTDYQKRKEWIKLEKHEPHYRLTDMLLDKERK